MRSLLSLLLLLGVAMNARAETYAYVSLAPEKKIQVFRLDPATGALKALGESAVEGAPGSLATDPQQKFLFASVRTNSSLASFTIDPAIGKLKLIGTASLPMGENAAFVATDRTGRWLISASYAAGKVVVHRLADDGTIETPAVQTLETTKTAHCIVFDRENKYAFVPHVAPNAVYAFAFNAATGKLTKTGTAPGGKEGAGPRHLAWHPRLSLGFTSDETGSSITAYRLEAGQLIPQQTLSTLPDGFGEKNTTAEVKVHPSGKFVWVSNRGHDSLAGFAIDAAGKLTAIGQTPTEKTPRSFDIDPSGRYLLSAGEGSGKLAVFTIDQSSGQLARQHTYDVGKSLTWVKVIELDGK